MAPSFRHERWCFFVDVGGRSAKATGWFLSSCSPGREARDFADVYVLALRFGNDILLDQAAVLDAGFDRGVLAQMMGTIVRFDDDEIPLTTEDVPMARAYFSEWAHKLRGSDR